MSSSPAATDSATVEHKRETVRPEKAAAVAQIVAAFQGSSASVLTEYRGLTVQQISDLRTALGADTTYAVVKNTLTKIAAADAGIEGLDHLLTGPTAVAFINGEPVMAAKALREFGKAHPALVVKGGVMDGQALSPDEIKALADLESREVLLGKMAGALLASLSNAVYLFNAPLSQAARLVGALEAKAAEDPSVIGGAGAPAALEETAPAEEAAPEAAAPQEDSADTADIEVEAPAAEAEAPAAGDADSTSETSDTSEPTA